MAVNLAVGPTDNSPSTQPLRLRPWQPSDLAALLEAHRDPEFRRWATTVLDDEQAAGRWLEDQREQWAAGTRYSFVIVTAGAGAGEGGEPGGAVVGGIGVTEVEREDGSAEVGYWVGLAHRRQGIASRALEAVSQWALDLPDGPGLDRLDLLHSVENERSCAVAHRAGYALQRVLPPLPPQFPDKGHLHARHTHAV